MVNFARELIFQRILSIKSISFKLIFQIVIVKTGILKNHKVAQLIFQRSFQNRVCNTIKYI